MKKPRLPKADKPAKAPKVSTAPGSNSMDPEKRALFLNNKDKYAKAVEKQKKASAEVRALTKTIKEDGFSIRQIKLAIQLDSPEGEAEFRSLISNDLLAAQYAGAAIGSQLQLFLEDQDRTPLEDRAWDEGVQASLKGETANPPYPPGSVGFERFMDGFHSTTEETVMTGIKPLSEMH